jgi:hypothetical protein
MDAGALAPLIHIPGYAESSSMRRSRPPTTRRRAATCERADLFEAALGARAPNWSSFPASKVVPSFRAHSAARNRPPALGLRCRLAPGTGPPFPASSAFAAAAKPQSATAAIPRGSAGGGRHSPDRVDGHHRRGVKRTAFDRHREPNQGRRPPQPPPTTITMPLLADARAGAISDVRQRGVCLGQALRSYGPARIAAPALSGPSPSRGEAALVSLDRAAA